MAIYKKIVILEGEKTLTCHLTLVEQTCTANFNEDIKDKELIVKEENKPLEIFKTLDGDLTARLDGITRIEIALIEKGDESKVYAYGATFKGIGKDGLLKEYKKLIPPSQSEIKRNIENFEVKEQFEIKKEKCEKATKPLEFYYSVRAQLDEMFICFPEIPTLSRAVPNSKWVKVDGADGQYAVGIIYEEDAPKYICYGVPSKRDCLPPDNMRKMCQYIASDTSDGYWVVFQDADTGETLTNN